MAFVRVCGGILAAFFALSFASEKAFAQEAECAQSDAYTRASGVWTFDIFASNPVDLSAPVSDISFPAAGAATYATQFNLLDDNVQYSQFTVLGPNGLLQFAPSGSTVPREVRASDVLEIAGQPARTNLTVLLLYDNADDVLHFAEMEPVERGVCEDALEGTENFFLDGNWQETRTVAEGNQGYVAAVEPVCGTGEILNDERDACIPDPNATPASVRSESKVRDNAWTAFGGALAVGVLSYLLSDGTLLGYSATPDFGYSLTESGYSVNAGGRVDFRKDRWHLYWTAGQQSVNGDFGDFRYSSGGKWQGDIFAAAFSEKVQGETTDYDLSLSANYDGGIWKVSPEFAIDSVYEKGEFATTNSFRINGEMRVDDWRFSASGNQTQMELSAVYRF